MVLPVHLRLSAVVAIVDCPDRSQFIGSRSLKQAAPQSIWLFQESLDSDRSIGLKKWQHPYSHHRHYIWGDSLEKLTFLDRQSRPLS
jgi:hypothetical protein